MIVLASRLNLTPKIDLNVNFIKYVIIFTLVGLSISYIGVNAIRYCSSGILITTHNQEIVNGLLSNVPTVAAIYIFGICTVVIEEVFYRGGIMGLIFKDYPIIGLIISSIIFGIDHSPTNPISFLIYSSLGLIWGIAYLKSKSLGLPIALHAINNIIGILFPSNFS